MINHTKRPTTITLEFTESEIHVLRYALHCLGNRVKEPEQYRIIQAQCLWGDFCGPGIGRDP